MMEQDLMEMVEWDADWAPVVVIVQITGEVAGVSEEGGLAVDGWEVDVFSPILLKTKSPIWNRKNLSSKSGLRNYASCTTIKTNRINKSLQN
jgi:hypothetical protein